MGGILRGILAVFAITSLIAQAIEPMPKYPPAMDHSSNLLRCFQIAQKLATLNFTGPPPDFLGIGVIKWRPHSTWAMPLTVEGATTASFYKEGRTHPWAGHSVADISIIPSNTGWIFYLNQGVYAPVAFTRQTVDYLENKFPGISIVPNKVRERYYDFIITMDRNKVGDNYRNQLQKLIHLLTHADEDRDFMKTFGPEFPYYRDSEE